MSALAKFYLSEKAKVSGSDLESSEITEELAELGAKIYTGEHSASNVTKNADLVIYNAAIKKDNTELAAAKSYKLKTKSYAEVIGELTKKYYTIAITGAHGKSTTTALIAKIMIDAGLDPTVVVGTKLNEFGGSNFKKGYSKYFIIEADEYAGSFLHYRPDIAVVTNIDREHLDFYKNMAKIKAAFKKFLLNVKPGGFLVLNNDNKEVLKLGLGLAKLKRFKNKIKWYSLRNKKVDEIKNKLQIPGAHNVSNALAAYGTGEILGIEPKIILKSLAEYGGAWRRFEYKGSINGAKIFDDYAHHPTEIRATLEAARTRFPKSRIWCIFQPHQRKRLSALFNEFLDAFDPANELVLLDPYEVSGRENVFYDGKFTAFSLAQKIDQRLKNNVYYLPYKSEVADFLKKYTAWGDVVIMMGAGDIWKITKELI